MIPLVQIILAIAFPVFVIIRTERQQPLKHSYLYSLLSFGCCAWGIIAELTTVRDRLFAGDIGGIEDTIGAAIILSVIITFITLAANLIAMGITYEE